MNEEFKKQVNNLPGLEDFDAWNSLTEEEIQFLQKMIKEWSK